MADTPLTTVVGMTFRDGRKLYFVHGVGVTVGGLEVAQIEDVSTKRTRGKPFPWPLWIVERECAHAK